MTNYIDSGGESKGCAVAYFRPPDWPRRPSLLAGLGIWTSEFGFVHTWGIVPFAGPAVWEEPQIYPSARREKPAAMIAKANACIRINGMGAACAHVLGWGRGGCRSVRPAKWKGQLPKPVHHRAIWALLTEPERSLLETAHRDLAGKAWSVMGPVFAYITKACDAIAYRKKPSYRASVTDLLDAVAFGLTEEGRFKL